MSPNVTYYYRLVAVDTRGNLSEPSPVVAGRAYQPPPEPPTLAVPVWDGAHERVTLVWSSPDPALESLVERKGATGVMWIAVSGWLARGTYSYVDQPPDPQGTYTYRIKVRDTLGQVSGMYQLQTTP